jgi:hypothetical protein
MDSYPNEEYKGRVNKLDQKKRNILADKEAKWRLKIRSLWLDKGDEKKKNFHYYEIQIHRKSFNMICNINKNDGFVASKFEDIPKVGLNNFNEMYKEKSRVIIE